MDENVFAENGIGHTEIKFLGQGFVIGCVEGEVDRTVRNIAQFETETGEVLKAVAGLDEFRAILMAGIISMERIEELELDLKMNAVDRSDSQAVEQWNSERLELARALNELSELVRSNNRFADSAPEEHAQTLSELEAGKSLLASIRISPSTLRAVLIGVLSYLTMNFVDQPIGEAASFVWESLKSFLSLLGSD
jgi:hypothetical protein